MREATFGHLPGDRCRCYHPPVIAALQQLGFGGTDKVALALWNRSGL